MLLREISRDALRTVRKHTIGYSAAQAKIIAATANTPTTGPATVSLTERYELAQLSFDDAAYDEITEILSRRLKDQSKWRRVLKSLIVLKCCLEEGSEKFEAYCRCNLEVLQDLERIGYVFEDNKDRGIEIRRAARAVISLLNNPENLGSIRRHAKSIRLLTVSSDSDRSRLHRRNTFFRRRRLPQSVLVEPFQDALPVTVHQKIRRIMSGTRPWPLTLRDFQALISGEWTHDEYMDIIEVLLDHLVTAQGKKDWAQVFKSLILLRDCLSKTTPEISARFEASSEIKDLLSEFRQLQVTTSDNLHEGERPRLSDDKERSRMTMNFSDLLLQTENSDLSAFLEPPSYASATQGTDSQSMPDTPSVAPVAPAPSGKVHFSDAKDIGQDSIASGSRPLPVPPSAWARLHTSSDCLGSAPLHGEDSVIPIQYPNEKSMLPLERLWGNPGSRPLPSPPSISPQSSQVKPSNNERPESLPSPPTDCEAPIDDDDDDFYTEVGAGDDYQVEAFNNTAILNGIRVSLVECARSVVVSASSVQEQAVEASVGWLDDALDTLLEAQSDNSSSSILPMDESFMFDVLQESLGALAECALSMDGTLLSNPWSDDVPTAEDVPELEEDSEGSSDEDEDAVDLMTPVSTRHPQGSHSSKFYNHGPCVESSASLEYPLDDIINELSTMLESNDDAFSSVEEDRADAECSLIRLFDISRPMFQNVSLQSSSEPFSPKLHATLDLTGKVERLGGGPRVLGGFSDVWKGRLEKGGSSLEVAVKVLRAVKIRDGASANDRVQLRMHREIDVWRRLDHENVVPLCGFTLDSDGTPGLVCPWYTEGNILDHLKKNPFADRKKLVRQTANGLAYLHCQSPAIVHADMKGQNVLVDSKGNAAIADFGLSKIMQECPSSFTTSNTNLGSLRWCSPERLVDDNHKGTLESDVWAFAALALEVLTGKVPFYYYENDMCVVSALLRGEIPDRQRYPGLPADNKFWDVLEACWSLNPADRPTMEQLMPLLFDDENFSTY